jgi:DNA-binding MarR family transcriptional regulator
MDEDLLDAASETFGSVFVVVQHLTRLTDEGLADWGLTTRQWLLLAVLTRVLGRRAPSLSEAAAAYGTSRQNVKQIAVGLQARGWLRLEPDPADARTTRLVLTDKVAGFDEPEGVARGRALLSAAFDGLTHDEVIALRDLVTGWLAALAAPGNDTSTAGPVAGETTRTRTQASRKGTSTR